MDGHQLVRVRVWPRVGTVTLAVLVTLPALLAIAVADSAWLISWIFGSLLVACAVFTLIQCSSAMGAFVTLLRRDGYARHVGDE
jgi:ABC-type Mn2+/Zn2+ transport system permease subunit